MKISPPLFALLTILIIASPIGVAGAFGQEEASANPSISLPSAEFGGETSIEESLYRRESVRSFADRSISIAALGQLLWAGNGTAVDSVSGPTRTAPSAGGLYPQELFVFAGNVDDLEAGVYRYDPHEHSLWQLSDEDRRDELAQAALNQRFISAAPAVIVIGGVVERTAAKYGERGAERYVYMDAALSAENIFLQATGIGIATLTVGAFDDRRVEELLQSDIEAQPLFIMPVGYPR